MTNQVTEIRKAIRADFKAYMSEESVSFYIGTNDLDDFVKEMTYRFKFNHTSDRNLSFIGVDKMINEELKEMAKSEYFRVFTIAKNFLANHIEELKKSK